MKCAIALHPSGKLSGREKRKKGKIQLNASNGGNMLKCKLSTQANRKCIYKVGKENGVKWFVLPHKCKSCLFAGLCYLPINIVQIGNISVKEKSPAL